MNVSSLALPPIVSQSVSQSVSVKILTSLSAARRWKKGQTDFYVTVLGPPTIRGKGTSDPCNTIRLAARAFDCRRRRLARAATRPRRDPPAPSGAAAAARCAWHPLSQVRTQNRDTSLLSVAHAIGAPSIVVAHWLVPVQQHTTSRSLAPRE